MDDFASFTPKDPGKGNAEGKGPAEGAAPRPDAAWLEEANRLLGQYSGRSESELLGAIYARAVQGKRDGTLTNAQIDSFYAQLSPLLDGFKRKKLKRLVEELKRI